MKKFIITVYGLFFIISFQLHAQDRIHVGQLVPNLKDQSFEIDFTNYKGKVVYLDFWASWCSSCKKSLLWLSNLKSKINSDQLVVLTINLDSKKEVAQNFLSSLKVDIPVIFDIKAISAESFQLQSMPSSIIIDRLGRINYIQEGFSESDENKLENKLYQLMQNT